MIGIGSIGLSRTVTSSAAKALEKKKSPEMFNFIPGYSEAKERAEEKRENGERWTSNPLFKKSSLGYTVNKDAVNKVREKLKEEGIDPSRRDPTHEVTDEQMAQLAEKYDLEYLSMAGMESSEYGNFLLDLAYMNVFSCDELENEFFGVLEPEICEICYTADGQKLYYDDLTGHFVTREKMMRSVTMEHMRVKEPGRTESYYQAKYEDYAAKKDERMNVIYDFFDRASQKFYPGLSDAARPIIEEASGKLKEDFGKIIA